MAKAQWEHKVVTQKTNHKGLFKQDDSKELTEILNEQGAQGWELVSTVPISATASFDLGGTTQGLLISFRRQKSA